MLQEVLDQPAGGEAFRPTFLSAPSMTTTRDCRRCKGTGQVLNVADGVFSLFEWIFDGPYEPCPTCGGSGIASSR